ncbi:3'-5' exonuclease [Pseudomonas nitroreducens]|uniref:3'-5' exonuclease n=1 Tax=Pseudomonas nitroreducens TaxID=46680 RepID=A0A5R8ZRF6_PSENT|nr:3'-5' exonuclease [Pseudomonas nitroreducens]TLP68208.1 3'-5' exonuclease [Pseudomonas nitroreducens]
MHLNTFDTETTGLPAFKDPSDAPHQPHLVEIAARLHDDTGALIDSFEAIIKPDGWIISPEVSAIHGITHERAMDEGIPEVEALEGFLAIHARSDLRIAHNLQFDDRILRIALMRYHGETLANSFRNGPGFCTCNASRELVRIPPTARMLRAGFNKFKNPSLAEAYQFFFGETFADAHRAMADAEACAKIYFAIKDREAGETLGAAAEA